MHRSSQRDKSYFIEYSALTQVGAVFLCKLRCPHGIAVAVSAKNSPLDCFINASTVLKEIKVILSSIQHSRKWVLFFCANCGRFVNRPYGLLNLHKIPFPTLKREGQNRKVGRGARPRRCTYRKPITAGASPRPTRLELIFL